MNKVLGSLQEAARLVKDGDTVAISGTFFEQVPMALLRAIIRRGTKDLKLVVTAHGIAVDILVGAGCVRQVTGAYIGFEGYGLAPNFRRGVEEGWLELRESACYAIASGLRAAALGLPFLPLRGLSGSDILKHRSEYRTFHWDGDEVLLVPALKPDVALIHAHRSDPQGNVQLEGSSWDDVIAEAADRVIVTVEEMVSQDEVRRTPERTIIPGFLTTAVVEVPYGAHPTGCSLRYDFDEEHIQYYLKAGKTPQTFQEYLDRYVYGPDSHEEYLELVGGVKTLFKLRR